MKAWAAADSLLSSPDTRIEDVLQWSEAIAAARKGYPALLAYLQDVHLGELIDYIIEDSDPSLDPRQAALFPSIAVEMMTDAPEVLDVFFSNCTYLSQFFSFLQKDSIDPTAAGYFSTVAQNLLSRNPVELVTYLFIEHSYGPDLVRHVGSRAVQEFLWKLLRCDPGLAQFSIEKLELLELLCECISDEATICELLNSSSILLELISSGRDIKGWRVYIALLLQWKVTASWCLSLISTLPLAARTAAQLITALLSLPDFPQLAKINYEDVDRAIKKQLGKPYTDSVPPVSVLPPLLANLLPLLPFLVNNLEEKSADLQLHVAIIHLITAISGLSGSEVTSSLVTSGAYCAVLALFKAKPWASFLHTAVETLVRKVLEGPNVTLKKDLLVTARLPEILAKLAACPYIISSNGAKQRRGQLGHITRIANCLVCKDSLQDILQPLYSQHWWTSFLTQFLLPQTSLEGRKLGQDSGQQDSEEESELFQEVTNTRLDRQSKGKDTALFIPEVACLDTSSDFQLLESCPSLGFQSYLYWRLPVPSDADLPALV